MKKREHFVHYFYDPTPTQFLWNKYAIINNWTVFLCLKFAVTVQYVILIAVINNFFVSIYMLQFACCHFAAENQ